MYITRKEAKEESLKYYFTGDACEKGHVAERLTISGLCVECLAERNESFLEDKKDTIIKKIDKRKARALKKEQRDLEIQMYKDDPDYRHDVDIDTQFEGLEFLPSKRRYAIELNSPHYFTGKPCSRGHLAPRSTSKATCILCLKLDARKHRLTKPDVHAALRQKRRARKFAAGGSFTADDIKQIYQDQNGLCNGCECDLEKSSYHVDHIMPLILMGSNRKENIQLLCPKCNLSKGGMTPTSWREKLERERRIKNGEDPEYHLL
jgi:5-methylcytosine-specific restriction endonuclease McrA